MTSGNERGLLPLSTGKTTPGVSYLVLGSPIQKRAGTIQRGEDLWETSSLCIPEGRIQRGCSQGPFGGAQL